MADDQDDRPFFEEDDPTPAGDTDELRQEVRSVDLPPGHPSQGEVKRREADAGRDMPGIPTDGEPPSSG